MIVHEGLRVGLVVTASGLGFRHGIDWDHIAAITDIAGSQDTPRRALGYATCYFAGHGAVVGALGVAAITAGRHLPSGLDAVMEHVVGATLILLGVYVVVSLARNRRDFRMRSRWMLVFAGIKRLRRPRSHPHPNTAPAGAYGVTTSLSVGALHGIGAETPTQVLLLVAAGGAGGVGPGLLLLAAFLAGLFASNSLVGGAAALGFLGASRNFALYASISVLTGAASLVVGALLFTGQSSALPSLVGG
jgi:high-affinity nickel-transport protein